MLFKNTRLSPLRACLAGTFLGWALIIAAIPSLSAQQTAASSGTQRPFKIKGFYIGMTRSLVHTELDRQKIQYGDSADHTVCAVGDGLQMVFFYDKKDQVFELDINPRAVDVLFNVSNLSINEFMTQFKQAYNLPDMDLLDLPGLGAAWKYKNEDEGFEVVICTYSRPYTQANKRLILSKIPLKSERRFD